MSYNNSLVSIGGNPYSYSRSSGNNIDTSNLLNTSHANHLFVNESGDSMSGILDMKNNKIINLGIPNRNNDASNKFYVDNSIVQATKNYGVLIKDLDNLDKRIINLKNETELKMKNTENLNRSYIKKLSDFQEELRTKFSEANNKAKQTNEVMIKHIETLAVEVAKDERKLIETKNEYDLKLRTVEENLKKKHYY